MISNSVVLDTQLLSDDQKETSPQGAVLRRSYADLNLKPSQLVDVDEVLLEDGPSISPYLNATNWDEIDGEFGYFAPTEYFKEPTSQNAEWGPLSEESNTTEHLKAIPIINRNRVFYVTKEQSSPAKEKEINWWLGKISEVHNDHFKALLEDLDDRVSIVEFDLDFEDKDHIFVGSIFTYAIFAKDNIGQREYRSQLSFSHRRTWQKGYEDKAKELADEIVPDHLLNL